MLGLKPYNTWTKGGTLIFGVMAFCAANSVLFRVKRSYYQRKMKPVYAEKEKKRESRLKEWYEAEKAKEWAKYAA